MKRMWPVRVEVEVKEAFERAAAELRIDASTLRRYAYIEYMSNHPSFFNPSACISTQSESNSAQEVA